MSASGRIEVGGLVIKSAYGPATRWQRGEGGALVGVDGGPLTCGRCDHTLGRGVQFESPGRPPIVLCEDCVIELVEGT